MALISMLIAIAALIAALHGTVWLVVPLVLVACITNVIAWTRMSRKRVRP